MKITAFTFVCDSIGESAFEEIAPDAVRGIIYSCSPKHDLRFVFVDDASKHQVGAKLVELCRSMGVDAHVIRFEQARGYRDGCERTLQALNWIHEKWPDTDLVIKTDCDAFVVREDFGSVLDGWKINSSNPTCWGFFYKMRRRDALLYLSDLVPIGFRRGIKNGMIGRNWELRRMRPVWWWRWGLKALIRGFRFWYVGGSFYVLNRAALKHLAGSGCFNSYRKDRLGFITSEEDVLMTTFLHACHGVLEDVKKTIPNWVNLRVRSHADLQKTIDAGTYVVHPIKRLGPSIDLIRELHDNWSKSHQTNA